MGPCSLVTDGISFLQINFVGCDEIVRQKPRKPANFAKNDNLPLHQIHLSKLSAGSRRRGNPPESGFVAYRLLLTLLEQLLVSADKRRADGHLQ
jgi:hypothetical protein